MDETASGYIIRIKGSSYYTLAQIFPDFHTWVRFSLEGRRNNSEFTQQDGRKKRTAKHLCVTNVTGLLLAFFVVIFT